MNPRIFVLALALVACDRRSTEALDAEELEAFQQCIADDDCLLVQNSPSACFGTPNINNPAAIHRDQVSAFRDSFAAPDCDFNGDLAFPAVEPPIEQTDLRYINNKFPVGCRVGRCTILEVRESVGRSCGPPQLCPAGYICEVRGGEWGTCFYTETSTGA